MNSKQRNPAVNLAPFGRWMLRSADPYTRGGSWHLTMF